MNVREMQINLSLNNKNGIAFLLSGIVVWLIITVIFFLPIAVSYQNILLLSATALLFPLSVIFSKLIKADWKNVRNPLGRLGLYLNFAQLMYFPIVFWAFLHSPSVMISFFAIIAGAHFFPYGWLYDAKPYFLFAPGMSVVIFFLAEMIPVHLLWLIPLTMVILLLLLIVSLVFDYKQKATLK